MTKELAAPARVRWARLRFQIIGPLLAAPSEPGNLQERLEELASRSYKHPTTSEATRFGVSTIERWYYLARNQEADPIEALARKVSVLAGQRPSVSEAILCALLAQYRQHPRWSYQLHYDNLKALVSKEPLLGNKMPSYNTLCRVMGERGLVRQRKPRRKRPGDNAPDDDLPVARETRSYESGHVHGLWHLDFHEGSRMVLLPSGEWVKAYLLGVMDDRSRLCCHLQWYLHETAEALVHGLSQALQKRGLPRSLMTDNGSAMLAAETVQGLSRLSMVHFTTLAYSPEQNGKQESFWGQIEGRLLPMLEGHKELSLPLLNEATQAWVEGEYNRAVHSETKQSPLDRMLAGPSVGRTCPSTDTLRRSFRKEEVRTLRRSDGTLTVEGTRFEVPARYLSLLRPTVRFCRWDLSSVDLVDPRTGQHLCSILPLDKLANSDRRRRVLNAPEQPSEQEPCGISPLLAQYMAEYAATGLPPAYLPLSPKNHCPPQDCEQEDP